jgi:Fic family protein
MEEALHVDKLKLKYELTSEVKRALKEVQELRDFAHYYELDADMFRTEAVALQQQRIERYAAAEEVKAEDIPPLLSAENIPATDNEQHILNIHALFQYMKGKEKETINPALLQQMHRILVGRMQNAFPAGQFRKAEDSLFNNLSSTTSLPSADQTQAFLAELLAFAKNSREPIFHRSFLFYYFFRVLEPFPDENTVIAILSARHILLTDDLDFFGLLDIEKHLFLDKEFASVALDPWTGQHYSEKLETDLQSYLKFCMTAFLIALAVVRQFLINKVKEQLGYDTLSPREKNSLNFWLEKAFFMYKDRLKSLTPRQHEIMLLIAKYGSLSNKELVPVFQVDRKTIQRDFNTLEELGLLEQRGAGRSLKYYLDFRINLPPQA